MSTGKKAAAKGSERSVKRARGVAGLDEQTEEGDLDEEEEQDMKVSGETEEVAVAPKTKTAKFVFDDEGDWDFTTMVPEVKLERPKVLTRALQPTKVYFTPLMDKHNRMVFFVIDGAYGARHYLASFDSKINMCADQYLYTSELD